MVHIPNDGHLPVKLVTVALEAVVRCSLRDDEPVLERVVPAEAGQLLGVDAHVGDVVGGGGAVTTGGGYTALSDLLLPVPNILRKRDLISLEFVVVLVFFLQNKYGIYWIFPRRRLGGNESKEEERIALFSFPKRRHR